MSVHVVEPRVTNDAEALATLRDVPYILYVCHACAKMFWKLVCKRYPELEKIR